MQWVQTGGNLHGLNLIHGLAGGIECTAQLQWWTTISIGILANEILHFLGIDERSGEGMLLCDDGIIVLETILSQHSLHLLVRTRSNLINHRPRISNLAAVVDIFKEASLYNAILCPALCVCLHASFHVVAIVRAVVGRLEGNRELASLVSLIEESSQLAHCENGIKSASQIGIIERISFFGDGESYHLQTRCLKNLNQASPILPKLLISLEAFCDRSDDLFFDGSVRLEAYEKREVIVRAISLVDDLVVEAFDHDDTTVVLARIECVVENSCREGTEDVACAKVNPSRLLMSLLGNCRNVILRKLITLGFPF